MASPLQQTTGDMAAQAQPAATTQPSTAETVDESDELAVDEDYESAYGDSNASDTTSIASTYKGYFENGRRYQNVREVEYLIPADDQSWESMEAGHMLMLILDSQRSNPLFQSPISEKAQRVLDVGTGAGGWAIDVADRFPNLTVRGVDLFPPPREWTAPNCIFECDDLSKPWTWEHKYDLVHMRHLMGSFDLKDWKKMYRRIYDNLVPGGWIEQVEMDVGIFCDDGSLPADSVLNYRDMIIAASEGSGRPLDTMEVMRSGIEQVGFINLQQTDYKEPIGTWPKLQVYKDAGRVSKAHFLKGIEGWTMFLLTRFAKPEPWTPEQVLDWVEKISIDINKGYHIYNKARRVWAQKPFDAKPNEEQMVGVENVQDNA